MIVEDKRLAVIAAVRHYLSDPVQRDLLQREKAYSAMFRAMQDLDIVEWEVSRLADRIERALKEQ